MTTKEKVFRLQQELQNGQHDYIVVDYSEFLYLQKAKEGSEIKQIGYGEDEFSGLLDKMLQIIETYEAQESLGPTQIAKTILALKKQSLSQQEMKCIPKEKIELLPCEGGWLAIIKNGARGFSLTPLGAILDAVANQLERELKY